MYEAVYAGCWTAACINTNFLVNRPLFQNTLAEYTASIFSFLRNMGGYDGFFVGFQSLSLPASAIIHRFNDGNFSYVYQFCILTMLKTGTRSEENI